MQPAILLFKLLSSCSIQTACVLWFRWCVLSLCLFPTSFSLTLYYRQTDLIPEMLLSNCYPEPDLRKQTVGVGSGGGMRKNRSCGKTVPVVSETF